MVQTRPQSRPLEGITSPHVHWTPVLLTEALLAGFEWRAGEWESLSDTNLLVLAADVVQSFLAYKKLPPHRTLQ